MVSNRDEGKKEPSVDEEKGKGAEAILKDIRVLDLSRFLAGPLCSMLLADMGAEVIRVEPPGGAVDRRYALVGPDGETLTFKILGRNKKSITLHLSNEKGRLIFQELVRHSDVVLHNFSPGTRMADEVSYEKLDEIHHGIIVAAISGYGLIGPDAQQVCFDFVTQARSGAMTLDGFPGDPPLKTAVPYVDCSSGMATAMGILLALYHKEKTGKGQLVDVSLFDIASFITQNLGVLLNYKVFGKILKQVGNFGTASYISCLKAKDGWVMVVTSSDDIWKKFIRAIDKEKEFGTDPKFGSDMLRCFYTDLIDPIIQEWAGKRTSDEIVNTLQDARVPCGKVNTVEKLLSDPQLMAREMIMNVEYPNVGELPIPGIPIKLSLTPGRINTLSPKVGEHNKEVYYKVLGYSPDKLAQLVREGVI